MILARAVHFLVLFVITTATTEFSSAAGSEVTVVNTTRGVIRGHVLKSYNENDYYAFQGIPYAAPSVGKNRLKEPREHDPWDGVLNTTENTKICMQPHYGDPFYESMERTEDCLLLNVFTPTKPGSKDLLPVLIWIHGGTFVGESATYFGPKFLMDYDIVIVTINYRIGAFGFLGTDDGVIPLNLGLKDQRFAMKWVNKNIHLFGGNPKQVTLAGQSAGSISVGYHLLGEWKDEEELFHRAIFHSGNTISGVCTQQNATNNAFNNAKYLDSSFSSNDTHELLALFQNADAQDILTKCFVNGVVQEENGPFSYQGYQSFLNGNYKKIPVMIGFTSEEEVNTITVNNTDNDTLEAFDKDPSLLISHDVNMSPENKQIAGKLFKDVYTNSSFVDHMGGYVRWWSDRYFTTGVCKQVELASIHSSYYFYQFSYKGELGHFMNTIIPEGAERVGHVEDMMYLWDAGWNTNLDEYPKEDQLMAQRFRKLWTNFIKYGNPTPEQDALLNNIYWQTSEPQSLRYLNINSTLEMLKHPRQYQRIKEILEKYMEPPYNIFS